MKFLLLLLLTGLAGPALARPVIVELYTSLACSSCPPADAILTELAREQKIIALSLNVTYWNSPAWSDPWGLKSATERQANYALLAHAQNVFTPQAIVDGTQSIVGSDRPKLTNAVYKAAAHPAGDVPVKITGDKTITISIGAGVGGAKILLFGYDPTVTATVPGGENQGETLTETNLVRSITNLGVWTGPKTDLTIPRPPGQRLALLLQRPDGAILGAATH